MRLTGVIASLEHTELNVIGEVQGAFISHERNYATFDISDHSGDSLAWLQVYLGGVHFRNVSRYLVHASGGIDTGLVDGSIVHVQGTLAAKTTGELQLHARRISIDPKTTGPVKRARQDALDSLRKDFRGRFPRTNKLDDSKGNWGLQNSFDGHDFARITVLLAERSKVFNEFEKEISGIRRDIRPTLDPVKVPFNVNAGFALARAVRAVDASSTDLIAIIRGGGKWYDFFPFNSEELARAILESPVPVVTGIGHGADLSLADMAANVSFLTPASLAASIATQRRIAKPRSQDAECSQTPSLLERLTGELENAREEAQRLQEELSEHENDLREVSAAYKSDLRAFGLIRIRTRSRLLGTAWTAISTVCFVLTSFVQRSWPPSTLDFVLLSLGTASFVAAIFTIRGVQRSLSGHVPKRLRGHLTDAQWWGEARSVYAPRHYKRVFGRR